MPLVTVENYIYPKGWIAEQNATSGPEWACRQLELGKILVFGEIPYRLPPEHRKLLISQEREESSVHKNISYRPLNNILRGGPSMRSSDGVQLKEVMRQYSLEVTRFMSVFLQPYANTWSLDFASYRPLEENGRKLPLRKRNDLLHVDAFPSRPTKGGRILRVFTNLNPTESRVWITTDGFQVLAERYAAKAGLEQIGMSANSIRSTAIQRFAKILRATGFSIPLRSAYDRFMLRFHNYLKENSEFQSETKKTVLEFPPNSTWVVFTDAVPHAVLSGRFALEHTYIVPVGGLLSPEIAPVRILEKLCGHELTA